MPDYRNFIPAYAQEGDEKKIKMLQNNLTQEQKDRLALKNASAKGLLAAFLTKSGQVIRNVKNTVGGGEMKNENDGVDPDENSNSNDAAPSGKEPDYTKPINDIGMPEAKGVGTADPVKAGIDAHNKALDGDKDGVKDVIVQKPVEFNKKWAKSGMTKEKWNTLSPAEQEEFRGNMELWDSGVYKKQNNRTILANILGQLSNGALGIAGIKGEYQNKDIKRPDLFAAESVFKKQADRMSEERKFVNEHKAEMAKRMAEMGMQKEWDVAMSNLNTSQKAELLKYTNKLDVAKQEALIKRLTSMSAYDIAALGGISVLADLLNLK